MQQSPYNAKLSSKELWVREKQLMNFIPKEIHPDDIPYTQLRAREENLNYARLKDGCFAYNKVAYDAITAIKDLKVKVVKPSYSIFLDKYFFNVDNLEDRMIIE